MISLLVYSVAAYGLAWIVGLSKISYPLRMRLSTMGALGSLLVVLLECAGCVGFHQGWIAYVLKLTPAELPHWWIAALFTATSNLVLAKLAGQAEAAH